MKIEIEHGVAYLYFTENCFISFINEWMQLFSKFNWYNWTLIKADFEWDMDMTGGIEFELIVLGLGFRFRWNLDFEGSETGKRLKEFNESNETIN